MQLFHPRVIAKHLTKRHRPGEHEAIPRASTAILAAGNYDGETQSDGEFIQRIRIDIWGYVGSGAGQTWTVAKNQPFGEN